MSGIGPSPADAAPGATGDAAAEPVIVAVASPPGRAVRGLVRLSGDDLPALLAHVIEAHPSSACPVRDDPAARSTAVAGSAERDPRRTRGIFAVTLRAPLPPLPCLMIRLVAPASYTGEESAELLLPGNPLLLDAVVEALVRAGGAAGVPTRRARPGEFTARAFLNGRLDAAQAEGVALQIAARTEQERRAAAHLAGSAAHDAACRWADEIATLLALVEAGIDFTDEEDVRPIPQEHLVRRLRAVADAMRALRTSASGGEVPHACPIIAITGPPNAGKSTLFNALLGRSRAIVSPIAGTTRDALLEPLELDVPAEDGAGAAPARRMPVMLADTAGEEPPDDALRAEMARVRASLLQEATLRLRCIPAGPDVPEPGTSELLVRTMADRVPGYVAGPGSVAICAPRGEGLAALRAAIVQRLRDRTESEPGLRLLAGLHRGAQLDAAIEHLQTSIGEAGAGGGAELIASALRSALDALAPVTGRMTPDDILGRIFATFCVGK